MLIRGRWAQDAAGGPGFPLPVGAPAAFWAPWAGDLGGSRTACVVPPFPPGSWRRWWLWGPRFSLDPAGPAEPCGSSVSSPELPARREMPPPGPSGVAPCPVVCDSVTGALWGRLTCLPLGLCPLPVVVCTSGWV